LPGVVWLGLKPPERCAGASFVVRPSTWAGDVVRAGTASRLPIGSLEHVDLGPTDSKLGVTLIHAWRVCGVRWHRAELAGCGSGHCCSWWAFFRTTQRWVPRCEIAILLCMLALGRCYFLWRGRRLDAQAVRAPVSAVAWCRQDGLAQGWVVPVWGSACRARGVGVLGRCSRVGVTPMVRVYSV